MKSAEFTLKERDSGLLVTFPQLKAIPHATSTRPGGFSQGAYDSLNLGLMSGDDIQQVERNRQRFSQWLGIPVVQNLKMDHGIQVAHVSGPQDMHTSWSADACITNHPEVSLSLTTADCVPIFFYDPHAEAVGLAHAGWRGTRAGIAQEVVRAMVNKLGARAENLKVALGPSIGPCCFEVGHEVAREFDKQFGERPWIRPKGEEKFHIDLHQANQDWLVKAGVKAENISTCSLCSCCREDLFFSWRRDQGVTGRMLSAIALTTRDNLA